MGTESNDGDPKQVPRLSGDMLRDLVTAAQQVDKTMVTGFMAACSFQRLDVALVAPGTIRTNVINSVTATGGTAEEWSDDDLTITSDGRYRLHIQRESCRAYLDEEISIQQRRREMHKSRPFRIWSSGEWCWFWRSRAHLHRRTKATRQFKEGAFLGPARVLLQERERKSDNIKYKAVVWIVDGDQLVLCSSAHLRPVSTAEQTLCSLRDGEARTFQQVVRELPKRNFVDLVGQPSPVEEDFEEPMDVMRRYLKISGFQMKRWHRLLRSRRQKLTIPR